MQINIRSLVFIVFMGILGNVLGFFTIKLPIPLVEVAFTISQLPALFSAIYIGSLEGGLVGLISMLYSTIFFIKNPLVPLGNFILAFSSGYFYRLRKRIPIFVACILGEVVETPFIWFSMILWSNIILGVPLSFLIPIIFMVNVKAFIEVALDSILLEILNKYFGNIFGKAKNEFMLKLIAYNK